MVLGREERRPPSGVRGEGGQGHHRAPSSEKEQMTLPPFAPAFAKPVEKILWGIPRERWRSPLSTPIKALPL